MTTATTAVCGLPRALTDGHPGPCHQPAVWVATVHCATHGPTRVLLCDYHHGHVADGRRVLCVCGRVATVWHVERAA